MIMSKCIVCGAALMDPPILVCDNMPKAAQHMPSKELLADEHDMTLELCQCSGCGLVQFAVEPPDYYRDVIRSGGYSTTMVELRRSQYTHFLDMCPLKNTKIIEVGCGQGEFLGVWGRFGFEVDAYGLENNPVLVKKARDAGLNVMQGFAVEENYQIPNGPFSGFCSFNFLEHQPDPNGMLRCIYHNLEENAYGLITVPSFEYIMEHEGFYELIRDHIAYFTKETFTFVLEMNGFHVLECTIVNRDTWAAIVEKKPRLDVTALERSRKRISKQISDFMLNAIKGERKLAVWGASHQGFTLLSNTGMKQHVSYVIDSAPFKQGLYTPGTHLPIVAPEYFFIEPVDSILIVAPGYTDEITSVIKQRYGEAVQVYILRSNCLERVN